MSKGLSVDEQLKRLTERVEKLESEARARVEKREGKVRAQVATLEFHTEAKAARDTYAAKEYTVAGDGPRYGYH